MIISRKLGWLAIAASTLALSACAGTMDGGTSTGATTSTSASADAPAAAMPTDMRGFVTMAASSDMFEIQSSQLAKSHGVTGEASALADHLIRDHTTAATTMTSMLASMNPPMAPPTSMTDRHRAMLEKLQGAGTGDAFARAYIDAQIMAHKEAVALYSNYSQRGDNPALRQFAQSLLPALQGHLEHAQRLNASR